MHSGTDQLQFVIGSNEQPISCGLHSGTDQLQFDGWISVDIDVVACTQARISYNALASGRHMVLLWLALRHGSVTMRRSAHRTMNTLWLALRHGSVTITMILEPKSNTLWLALRHGSVTIGNADSVASS